MMRMASLAKTACVSVDARCLETALPAIPSSTRSALIAKALLIPHIDALILRFLEIPLIGHRRLHTGRSWLVQRQRTDGSASDGASVTRHRLVSDFCMNSPSEGLRSEIHSP